MSRIVILYNVFEVCEVILFELGVLCLKFLFIVEEWKVIEIKFSERWNFLYCVGVLDGKYVVM